MTEKLYRIKPLVWVQEDRKCWCSVRGHYIETFHKANSRGLLYVITDAYGPVTWNWYSGNVSAAGNKAESIKAAKAACEAHWQARMREGLDEVTK